MNYAVCSKKITNFDLIDKVGFNHFFYIIDELADWQLGLGYLDNSYYRPSKIYSLSERVSQALKACVQT